MVQIESILVGLTFSRSECQSVWSWVISRARNSWITVFDDCWLWQSASASRRTLNASFLLSLLLKKQQA